jgi:hypothetical protein
MTFHRKRTNRLGIWTILVAAALGGCASQAPTIAHVHLGHAITGASNTPGQAGYLVVAEERARQAVSAADDALAGGSDLPTRQAAIRQVNEITNTREDFPLVNAISEAASHVEFAANSPDASSNVKAASRDFSAGIDGIIERSELIGLYVLDAQRAQSVTEFDPLAEEIARLARANLEGDSDADGPAALGVAQLKDQLDAAIAREDPPYSTVDRWYLFNLVRLPSGEWIFRRDTGGRQSGY